jgi:integrase
MTMPRRRRTNQTLPPHLYMEKHGSRYYFRYRDPATGKKHGFGTDRSQAIKAAMQLNAKRLIEPAADLVARVEGTNQSMGAWLDRYWTICHERNLAANTLRVRKSFVAGLRAEFGGYRLDQITTRMIADFLQVLRDAGKDRSAQAYRSLMLDVFRTAMAEGWATTNPAEVTRAPTVKVKRARLTLDTFTTILTAAGGHREPWVANAMLLALVTAQRVEDVAEMQFSDVSGGWLHVTQRKTGTRVRIALDVRLDAVGMTVGDVVKRCRDRVLARHLIHHSRSYGNAPAGSVVHKDSVSRGFQWAREQSGLTWDRPPPTFHEIRSLAGRLYKNQGVDPQAILGHKDARTTAIYIDVRGAEWVEVKT